MTGAIYDAIVLGVGGMGSAICHQLARRGLTVLGLEQFAIGHDRGSSHGQTRVIRKAYFEDPRYVPMLHRTYELWQKLEAACGERLMRMAGCLNLGPPSHAAICGVRRSVDEHGLPHELLDAGEMRRRWPVLRPADGDVGIYEEGAGFLVPERCVAAHVAQARKLGATILENQPVRSWRGEHERAFISTDTAEYEGRYVVIAGGPWLPILAAELNPPLRVERQVQAWFAPKIPDDFKVGRLPVLIHFVEDRAYYAIPICGQCPPFDGAVKVARHHGGVTTTADSVSRIVSSEDEADIRWYLKRHLPDADGSMVAAEICLYTNTPDEHFIIDRHPRHPNVIIAGGFSGHGFKFAPVVGEMVAELLIEGRTRHAIDLFSLRRFADGAGD